jgi:hypothetical protein
MRLHRTDVTAADLLLTVIRVTIPGGICRTFLSNPTLCVTLMTGKWLFFIPV